MTAPFVKVDPLRPATSAWLVHQVGDAVEVVHVGPNTPDVAIAISRMATLFANEHRETSALAGDGVESPIGLRIERSDQDAVWRTILGHAEQNTKVDSSRVLIGVDRRRYIQLATMIGERK